VIQYDSNGSGIKTTIAFVCGILGGFIKLSFVPSIVQAAFTALICGAAGVAGKELYSQFAKPFLKKILKKFKKRKV
jgi:hypothetical protein